MTNKVTSSELLRVYVGVGCNLGERERNIVIASEAINALPGCSNCVISSVYETEPLGPADQPHYLNAVIGFDCALEAHVLLKQLQQIETDQLRVRTGERWGPRTLDLDILLYGAEQISTEYLSVPHPGIAVRSFVLVPLLEIAPDITIPGLGAAEDLLAECPKFGISVHTAKA